MKNKRSLSILLATVICLFCMPLYKRTNSSGLMTASAKTYQDYFLYKVTDQGVIVTGYTDDIPSEVDLMFDVNGKKITSIGWGAFRECKKMTSIRIGRTVTNIGDCAFTNCTALTSIIIPNSVTSIGSSAFGGCTSLNDITIPNSVTNIGSYAFCECTSLNDITIPDSVTNIGELTFALCNGLESITLPDNLTSIGAYAFNACTSLKSIEIPKSVEYIGEYAFSGCDSLESITIPDSVIYIGDYAFQFCSNLTSITIPDNMIKICDYTCEFCDNLQSITIPDSVTSIGKNAFSGCKKLTIKGYAGSYAETYAKANKIPFESIGDVPVLKGDVNGDGDFNISDIVIFQKWLLAVPDTELKDWRTADLCQDNKLDVFDLCLLRRELIAKMQKT